MEKQIINTQEAPPPIGPYNQAILAGDTLYISGQICLDPKTGELKNMDIQEETNRVMQNLKAILSIPKKNLTYIEKLPISLKKQLVVLEN